MRILALIYFLLIIPFTFSQGLDSNILNEINKTRTNKLKSGNDSKILSDVQLDWCLKTGVITHSNDSLGSLSNRKNKLLPNGNRACGEIITRGTTQNYNDIPKEAITNFLESPKHKEIMLSNKYKEAYCSCNVDIKEYPNLGTTTYKYIVVCVFLD
jgi:uncharacterized protein YkwD